MGSGCDCTHLVDLREISQSTQTTENYSSWTHRAIQNETSGIETSLANVNHQSSGRRSYSFVRFATTDSKKTEQSASTRELSDRTFVWSGRSQRRCYLRITDASERWNLTILQQISTISMDGSAFLWSKFSLDSSKSVRRTRMRTGLFREHDELNWTIYDCCSGGIA